ncbi:MAG: glycoside hydrolase family 38 C-terminal domain-containing protein [Treponemataceae bacterium]
MNDWKTKGKSSIYLRDAQNFLERLSCSYLRDSVLFSAEYARSASAIPLRESVSLNRVPIKEGERWGGAWESGYFKLEATVGESWKGREIAAHLDFGGEGLIYDDIGTPLYGITNTSSFDTIYRKDVYRLGIARGGEKIILYVEAAANGLMGIRKASEPISRTDPGRHGSWEASTERMRLCLFDWEQWLLYRDFGFLLNLLQSFDDLLVRPARILKALREAIVVYGDGEGKPAAARERLRPELEKRADASALHTTVMGHAHIDTAWLWPLRETRRKVARTFASQLDLIDRYPDFIFGASAAQHYAWVQEVYPVLFERIKKAIAAGRWEIQGGMWVESDCNLISGESMIRQIGKGRAFFRNEFGVEVDNCWIPDVFGYPASMPQILKKSGIPFFLTQKMSWSKFNEFPHDTFRWRGIDGSQVLTHFPPEKTYNSYGTPAALRKAERNFKEKDVLDDFITLLGMGDGGGGPKEDHVENILLSRDCEGVPEASFGTARDFFRALEPKSGKLECWTGELYLEYHRGTYTTQARTKKNNRRMEEDLRATEALLCCAPLSEYPRDELDELIKTMLLLQFHDIIPGSSIRAVYQDAERMHADALDALAELRGRAAEKLFDQDGTAFSFFNCLMVSGPVLVKLPAEFARMELIDRGGKPAAAQTDERGRTFALLDVPSQGFATLYSTAVDLDRGALSGPLSGGDAEAPRAADELTLENELVRYRFDPDGTIVEAWDKDVGRAILAKGSRGNLLSLYGDTPHDYEAWDIDFYYTEQCMETARPSGHRKVASGPVYSAIAFDLEIGSSRIRQTATLVRGNKALSFKTEIDWKETRRMLRTSFALETTATEAACDIQFAFVKRPLAVNTGWDFAKFEFCAHRYVDVSDENYGAALLNDCKYGYSAREGVIGLTLLRSPLYPDPEADVGFHEFEYRLLPHRGSLISSSVMAEAALMNRPPLLFTGVKPKADTRVPVIVEGAGVDLSVLKKAEEGEEWVFRLVETRGLGARARARATVPGAYIRETNLIEREDGEERPLDPFLDIELKPFELRTFKVRPLNGSAISPLDATRQ